MLSEAKYETYQTSTEERVAGVGRFIASLSRFQVAALSSGVVSSSLWMVLSSSKILDSISALKIVFRVLRNSYLVR